jgi:hypothetical protein
LLLTYILGSSSFVNLGKSRRILQSRGRPINIR